MVRALNQYLAEWSAPNGGGVSPNATAFYDRATISNTTTTNLKTGAVLAVTGMRNSSSSPVKAKSLFCSSGFQLAGAEPSNSDETLAVLLESIPAGRIGRCRVSGIVAAYVLIMCDTHKYAAGDQSGTYELVSVSDETGAGSGSDSGSGSGSGSGGGTNATTAQYRIIAKSAIDANSRAFCYLLPIGGTSTGHLIGTITAVSGDEYTVDVDGTVYTAASPLGELTTGTKVAIDQCRSGGWNILAAECPSDEGSGS